MATRVRGLWGTGQSSGQTLGGVARQHRGTVGSRRAAVDHTEALTRRLIRRKASEHGIYNGEPERLDMTRKTSRLPRRWRSYGGKMAHRRHVCSRYHLLECLSGVSRKGHHVMRGGASLAIREG
jgi:hypothetical protein